VTLTLPKVICSNSRCAPAIRADCRWCRASLRRV